MIGAVSYRVPKVWVVEPATVVPSKISSNNSSAVSILDSTPAQIALLAALVEAYALTASAFALLNAGVSVFDISLDAFNNDTYAKIRVKGNLDNTKKNQCKIYTLDSNTNNPKSDRDNSEINKISIIYFIKLFITLWFLKKIHLLIHLYDHVLNAIDF